LQPSPDVARAHATIRGAVPHLDEDRVPAPDIEAIARLLRSNAL